MSERTRETASMVAFAVLLFVLFALYALFATPAHASTLRWSTYGTPGDCSAGTASGVSIEQPHYDPKAIRRWRGRPIVAMLCYPLGTTVRITVGKVTVDAIVLDRGPYVSGRSLDIGPVVARRLHVSGIGTAKVVRTGRIPKRLWRTWRRVR